MFVTVCALIESRDMCGGGQLRYLSEDKEEIRGERREGPCVRVRGRLLRIWLWPHCGDVCS